MKKKVFRSLSLFLVFAFALSLAVPSANVMAAGKGQKKKVLVAYFSATGTTEAAAVKLTADEIGALESVADEMKLNVIRGWEKEMK